MLDRIDIAEAEAHGHSLFGASKAHRYLVCAGSLLGEIGKPDTAGIEAAEGTVAHEIAAKWLEFGLQRRDFGDYIGRVVEVVTEAGQFKITVDALMLNFLESYVDWCRAVPGEPYYEQRVDFSRLCPIPRQGGTADHFAIEPGSLTITDLKYGTGVQVFAKRNPQAMLYALGVFYEWDWLYSFTRITIRICQPRLDHYDTWEVTSEELLAWADWAKERMALCWQPHAPLTPTEDACKFCKCRGTCPAAVALVDRMADQSFEDTTVSAAEVTSALSRLDNPAYEVRQRDVRGLTTPELARFLRVRKVVEHHFEAAYTELERRVLVLHEPMPAEWMLAQGKSSRSVANERGAIKRMAEAGFSPLDLYKMDFKSPAELEKMLVADGLMRPKKAAAFLGSVIRTVPGKPTLSLAGPGKKEAVDLADLSFVDETL